MKLANVLLAAIVTLLGTAAGRAVAAEFNAAMSSIRASDIEQHIEVLADDSFEGREAGTRGGHAAGVYLVKRLQRYGLKPAGDDGSYFQVFDGAYRNVLGLLEGSDPELKNEFVVVGAHYDHVGYGTQRNSYGPIGYIHNGADDNASGIAGLLEVVEAFTSLDRRPKRSVLFACWDGEEKGLLGSKHWAAQPTVPLPNVVFALNADMIGRLSGKPLMIYGSRSGTGLRQFVSQQNRGTNLPIDFTWEMKANSDHHSFYARGIPVLMLHTGLHDDYHRPSDDAHLVDHQGAEQVARFLFQLVHALADEPQKFEFREASSRESVADQQQFERTLAAPPSRLGVTWYPREGEASPIEIVRVAPNSAADRAGLLPGDRIIKFNNVPVGDESTFRMRILAAPAESEIVVRRNNEELTLPVELRGTPMRLGISWRSDDAEPGTVVISRVVPGSAAHYAKLQAQDRIYQVDGEPFKDSQDFQQRVSSHPGPVTFEVERRGQLFKLEMALPPLD